MNVEEYIDILNFDSIQQKINLFEKSNFLKLTDIEIERKIIDIFFIGDKMFNPTYIITIPENSIYCKIRKFDYVQNILDNKKFDINEVLANPNPKLGRMNLNNEKGLYLAKNIKTALLESNIKNEDIFTLTIFDIKQSIDVLGSYISNRYGNLTEERNKKANLINDFLYKYLKLPSSSNENIYRITNIIKKIFFNYPCDGIFYLSSKIENNFNIFLNYNSLSKVEPIAIVKCIYRDNKVEIFPDYFLKIKNNSVVPKIVPIEEQNELLNKLNANIKNSMVV